MRLNFEDGSFVAFVPSITEGKITLVVCGRKNRNETVMSSSDITRDQAIEMVEFLTKWLENGIVE